MKSIVFVWTLVAMTSACFGLIFFYPHPEGKPYLPPIIVAALVSSISTGSLLASWLGGIPFRDEIDDREIWVNYASTFLLGGLVGSKQESNVIILGSLAILALTVQISFWRRAVKWTT